MEEERYIVEDPEILNTLPLKFADYARRQSWTGNFRKGMFTAFLDVMNKGITGVHGKGDTWYVDINGDGIDLNQNKYYGYVADFLSRELKSVLKPYKAPKEPEKEKFSNQYFISSLQKLIGNDEYGGISNWKDLWNKNSRDEKRQLLASYLRKYKESFNPDNLSFEDSPFNNDEFNTRLNAAIAALEDSSADPTRALNRLGINIDEWMPEDEIKPEIKVEEEKPIIEESTLKKPVVTTLEAAQIKNNILNWTINSNHHVTPRYDTPYKLDTYSKNFENALNVGVNNLTHEEVQNIANFINLYGLNITSGEFTGGKFLSNYPNLILYNGRLYLTGVSTENKDIAFNIYNLGKEFSTKLPTFSKEPIDIGGKKLSVRSVLERSIAYNPIFAGSYPKYDKYGAIRILASMFDHNYNIHPTFRNWHQINYNGKTIKINPNDPNVAIKIKQSVAKLLKESRNPITTAEISRLKELGWLKKGGKL